MQAKEAYDRLAAPAATQMLLGQAFARRASDVHLEPTACGYELRLRVDGRLETVAAVTAEPGRAIVTRLMVLAGLLTYRTNVPQEGRFAYTTATGDADAKHDLRLAVMPTAKGLRAVIRLPAELHQPRRLEDLGLAPDVLSAVETFCCAEAGALLVVGPAGSGKTTTLYAVLERLAASGDISVVTLEDPVERHLPGVTQIQVEPFGELTYERALRSILRQDPQVLMLGEIRDAATAHLAVQAALSGHRLLATLHAAEPAAAIARLLEMGVAPYQLTSSLHAVVAQRLVRRKAAEGYAGRTPIAAVGRLGPATRRAVLASSDAQTIGEAMRQDGAQDLSKAARDAVDAGLTDEAEVARLL